MIILIKKLIAHLVRLPLFIWLFVKDVFNYIVLKQYKQFTKYGLHIWVAKFGGGKTSTSIFRFIHFTVVRTTVFFFFFAVSRCAQSLHTDGHFSFHLICSYLDYYCGVAWSVYICENLTLFRPAL